MDQRRYRANSYAIHGLWLNWALSVGALAATLFCALFISKLWLPAVVLGFQFLLMGRLRVIKDGSCSSCGLIPYVVIRILFITAVLMVAINFYCLHFVDHGLLESGVVNLKIPYITVLIVAPVTFIVSTVAYFRNHSLSVCFECHARFGRSNERGFLGNVFSREGRFQLRMLMLASLIITVYAWIYYFWRYSNVNYNSADLFFYIWIPIILYVLSLVNLGIRYVSIDAFYRKNIAGEANDHVSSTLIRYIILCGDNMFLRIGGTDDLDTKADTPAQSYVPYRERVSEYDAINTFSNIVGNAFRPNLRFLYENSNFHIDCNIFHYICVLDSASELHGSGLDGEWLTQSELLRMVENREVSPMLISEIERLYTVIMAFKTYDISGRRLYDIKHYKPSFRLHDIASLLVDYNDPQWLFVAKDNEDRPFFYFKRFWRRYVRGISD
ncbi:hypothetical protein [Muribaculum intestinale]|jgi:hypothetical protein|uniref:hypothetical protein n=1 Tax=Muribaculum intestinale TaxID=1796646 RepID=UPI00242C10F7|nr:hypothetical protein [Muribaculum intestinale]